MTSMISNPLPLRMFQKPLISMSSVFQCTLNPLSRPITLWTCSRIYHFSLLSLTSRTLLLKEVGKSIITIGTKHHRLR